MRVQTVYQLLADALTNEEIIRFAAENRDVGRRQTENYIAEARIAQDCAIHGTLAGGGSASAKDRGRSDKAAQYQVQPRFDFDRLGSTTSAGNRMTTFPAEPFRECRKHLRHWLGQLHHLSTKAQLKQRLRQDAAEAFAA